MVDVFVRVLIGHLSSLHVLSLSLLVVISFTPAAAAETLELSLSDALSITLKENRSIQIYRLEKDISGHNLDFESSIFIPSVQAAYSYSEQDYDQNNLSALDDTEEDNYSLSINQLNSIGGTSSLNFSSSRDSTSYITGLDTREYNSSVFLKYDQPVFEGFGTDVTRLKINNARIDRDLASQEYEDMRSNIFFNVYRDYFQLYSSSEELRLRREIRKKTEEIRDMVREKVEARKLPVTELNTMEAALFVQDKLILDLENRKQKRENRLMLSMFEETKTDTVSDIVILNLPEYVMTLFHKADRTEANRIIQEMDIALIKFEKEMDKLKNDRIGALDEVKPDLNLSVEFGIDGNDFDERGKSIENISSSNYRAMVTGTLMLPVINRAANSKLALTNSKIEQVRIKKLNRKNEISNIVDELFDDFQTVMKKMELDSKIVGISKENLENEIERLIGEKTTALNTLDYQTDYITAQIGMLQTSVEYIILIGTYHLYTREIDNFMSAFK